MVRKIKREKEVEAAISTFLEAINPSPRKDLQTTPARVANLWIEHLLAHENSSIDDLQVSPIPANTQDPILIKKLGLYMVCPHHLTIGSGFADIAYLPKDHIIGFGNISNIVAWASQRLTLQEEVGSRISEALKQVISPKAIVSRLVVQHPCHTILHPRSHNARIETFSIFGEEQNIGELKNLLTRSDSAET